MNVLPLHLLVIRIFAMIENVSRCVCGNMTEIHLHSILSAGKSSFSATMEGQGMMVSFIARIVLADS